MSEPPVVEVTEEQTIEQKEEEVVQEVEVAKEDETANEDETAKEESETVPVIEEGDVAATVVEDENPEQAEAGENAETPVAEQPAVNAEEPEVVAEGDVPEAEPPAEAPEGEGKEGEAPAEQGEVPGEGSDAAMKEEITVTEEVKAAEEVKATEEGTATEEVTATEETPEVTAIEVTPAQEGSTPTPGAEEETSSPIQTSDQKTESPSGGKEEELSLEERTLAPDDELPLVVEGDLPEPGTPEKVGSEIGEEEELLVVEEEPKYNREDLVQQYQAAMQEREQLTQQNRALQHKLSEYFRKKKADDSRQEMEKSTADQEQRYMKYMSNLEELREQESAENENYQEQLREMKEKKAEKQQRVEEEWTKAVEFKRNVALSSINSRSGRPIPPKDIEMYELHERKKELEVSQVRLEYIKLKNRLKKQETQLKQKEELAEGLHLIDFEQLKIENQTYNEKIEERNEELLKLRKKITNTVQVLTHLKEKLQFVQAENMVKREQLNVVEREVAQKRDILSRTKQSRDNLRHENTKFQQKCGLLGNTDLLRDFEMSTDEATDLEHRLDLLKRTHAELTLSLNGIKKKIELAKENQS